MERLETADLMGKLTGLETSFDFTLVEQAEAWRESQRTLATLMSNLPGMAYRSRNDREWTIEFVSEGCYQLTGYHPLELIDNQLIAYADLIHPEDQVLVWNQIQAALQTHRPFQLVYRLTTATGEEKWVWEQGCGVFSESGELLAVEGFVTDITARKRAEEELQLLQGITQAISDAGDFHAALKVALSKVCEATSWNLGEAWIPSKDGTVLECSWACYSSTESLEEFRRQSQTLTFGPGIGLPGRVWLSHQPEWIPDVSMVQETIVPRTQIASFYGLRAGFSVPIISDNQVLAVLAFFMFEARTKDKRLVELVSAVASQLGTVLRQKQAEAALRESQRRLASLINSLPGIVFSCRPDAQWSMSYLSEGCLTLTGYSSEELINGQEVSYTRITHPEDLPKVTAAIGAGVAKKQPYVVEYRIRTKSGQEKWVWEKGCGVFDRDGKFLGLEGFISDITERIAAEEATRQAEAKYRSIFENALEGIFQTTPDGKYISANPALARVYGYSSPAELMVALTDIEHQLYVDPSSRRSFIRLLQEHDAVSDFESAVYRQDGTIIWISENARAVRDDAGTLLYYEGTVEDITERKQAKEQLVSFAYYDALTGLPNRPLFMERLRQAVELAKLCKGYSFAILFLDLDGFKVVNDSQGHLVGDQLLVAVAERLKMCVRPVDMVARLGGDEFTILLDQVPDINSATVVVERIHHQLRKPFNVDGHEVFTTASIGLALNDIHYERAEDLLRDADTALYRAKALGKARHEVFDQSMHQKAIALLQLETQLRRAVENQEFQIHYQPIVSLSTGKITGFEALLRLLHPEGGFVPCAEFIPVAEEMGLLIPVGWWILRQACHQLLSWQRSFPANPPLTISVNLSGKQFSQPDLLAQIDAVLQETGLNGENLYLEITETVIMENAAAAAVKLRQLRERNIQLCIDDFGTGYSSLSYLHHLPMNALKIDQCFVSGVGVGLLPASPKATGNQQQARDYELQIAKTMVMLAHNLGMNVIAEGVETDQQLTQLRELGCDYGQGYFFSEPVNAEAVEMLLISNENSR